MGYTEYLQVIRDQSEGFTSKMLKKLEISSLIVDITNNHILGSEVFVTVYLEAGSKLCDFRFLYMTKKIL